MLPDHIACPVRAGLVTGQKRPRLVTGIIPVGIVISVLNCTSRFEFCTPAIASAPPTGHLTGRTYRAQTVGSIDRAGGIITAVGIPPLGRTTPSAFPVDDIINRIAHLAGTLVNAVAEHQLGIVAAAVVG